MKRNRCLMFIFLMIICVTQICAQQADDKKKEINKIKKSSLYLYEEATMPDKEEAMETALELLQMEVQRWVAEKKKRKEVTSDLIITNVEQLTEALELPRGDNMYRAFVYVKKSDVLVSKNTMITDMPSQPESSDKLKSSYEVISASKVEHPEYIQRLLTLKKSVEIIPCLDAMKSEGLVLEYAPYTKLSQHEDYVLIIHNKQGKVEAILSDGVKRVNFRTNLPDGVDNYKGRGAVGVKFNK